MWLARVRVLGNRHNFTVAEADDSLARGHATVGRKLAYPSLRVVTVTVTGNLPIPGVEPLFLFALLRAQTLFPVGFTQAVLHFASHHAQDHFVASNDLAMCEHLVPAFAQPFNKITGGTTDRLAIYPSARRPCRNSRSHITIVFTQPQQDDLLALRQEGDGTVRIAIAIRNNAEYLKGMRLTVDYGYGNKLVAIEKGSLIAGAGDTFLGTLRDGDNRIFIDVASLGIDRPFEGSGEVVRLVIRPSGNDPVVVRIAEADLRDVNNQRDIIESTGGHERFVPTISALHQNHPNPFNPVTTVSFDLATAGNVTIRIFDISGRLVRTLVNEDRPAGRHEVVWNGRNNSGVTVTTGVYFYKMSTPGFTSQTKKMLLLK